MEERKAYLSYSLLPSASALISLLCFENGHFPCFCIQHAGCEDFGVRIIFVWCRGTDRAFVNSLSERALYTGLVRYVRHMCPSRVRVVLSRPKMSIKKVGSCRTFIAHIQPCPMPVNGARRCFCRLVAVNVSFVPSWSRSLVHPLARLFLSIRSGSATQEKLRTGDLARMHRAVVFLLWYIW